MNNLLRCLMSIFLCIVTKFEPSGHLLEFGFPLQVLFRVALMVLRSVEAEIMGSGDEAEAIAVLNSFLNRYCCSGGGVGVLAPYTSRKSLVSLPAQNLCQN